ncbi:hypothetical protein [Streptomyces bacillaris]|uniref:hypothetical protein n=1 Tax=Streptomyces bacillaris TaxID=68179 RepID=UPI003624DE54
MSAYRSTILLAVTLALTGCAKPTTPPAPASVPVCAPSTRTPSGDLVPHGPRPCLLTTPTPAPSTRTEPPAGHHAPGVAQPAPPVKVKKQPPPPPAAPAPRPHKRLR